MNFQFSMQFNDKLAIRNPESTELGKKIIREGLLMMAAMGYEQFTFRKLAEAIGTTEASIYRYFENKHRLLLYYLTWYWNALEYSVVFSLQNMTDPARKIHTLLNVLCDDLPDWMEASGLDKTALHGLAMSETSKTYLIKDVDDINREKLFKPYKDLCGRIAQVFLEYNPRYPYPRSLASTIIEMAHLQPYFAQHLPLLTDLKKDTNKPTAFLENLVFAALDQPSPI